MPKKILITVSVDDGEPKTLAVFADGMANEPQAGLKRMLTELGMVR